MNNLATEITPTCYFFNNRGHGPLRFVGCTVVSETKTTITVRPVAKTEGSEVVFQKVRNLDGSFQDPRLTTATSRHSMIESISERGGDRFYPTRLTFDLEGVKTRKRVQKDIARRAQLIEAKAQLQAQREALVRVGYMEGDEVLACIDKTLVAYTNDLTCLDEALKA